MPRTPSLADSKPPEAIETARLLLRRYSLVDEDVIFEAVMASPNVAEFQSWPTDGSGYYTSPRWAAENFERWEKGTAFVYAVLADDRLLGSVDFRRRPQMVEFGYWLREDALGKGFAFEACVGMLKAASELEGVRSIEAHTDSANLRSKRLLEKLGLEFSGETVVNPSPGKLSVGRDEIWKVDSNSFLEKVS